ncbi:MAG: Nucleoporin nup84 [Alyxoria varia]|nr:MAG: Nucleoporin nup84 [Alyxoria varia]
MDFQTDISVPNGDFEDAMEVDQDDHSPPFEIPEPDGDPFPLRDMAERVGREVEEFAERLDKYVAEAVRSEEDRRDAAFDIVKDYRIIAEKTVKRLDRLHGAGRSGNEQTNGVLADDDDVLFPQATSIHDLHQWQNELNTWRLLEEMLERLSSDTISQSQARKKMSRNNDRFTADGGAWQDFIVRNPVARERYIVLKWLEESADRTWEDIESLGAKFGNQDDLDQGWLHTREKIKSEKRFRRWDNSISALAPQVRSGYSSEYIVTQLDPDAVTRLNRALEPPDKASEDRCWTLCWQMLRRGWSMDDVRRWCEDHNEQARAMMIGATPDVENTKTYSNGINGRYRWRKACFQVARDGGMNQYEKAVFGLLGGDLKSLEPVSFSWEDHLFAQYNTLLLAQYRRYLHRNHSGHFPPDQQYSFGHFDAVNYNREPHDIQTALQLSEISRVDYRTPFKLIQSQIIGHRIQDFLVQQGVALAQKAEERATNTTDLRQLVDPQFANLLEEEVAIESVMDNYDALRFLAHVVILLQFLDTPFDSIQLQAAADNILAAYIEFLLLAGKLNLIPLYASWLSGDRAIRIMAKVLPDVTDENQRQEYLQLMQNFGMDVHAIFTLQYEYALAYSLLIAEGSRSFQGIQLLEDNADFKWPGKRLIAHEVGPLDRQEEKIVQSTQWFQIISGTWFATFTALTEVAQRLLSKSGIDWRFIISPALSLLTLIPVCGRVDAAIQLFEILSPTGMSLKKTKDMFGVEFDVINPSHELMSNPPKFKVPGRNGKRRVNNLEAFDTMVSAMQQEAGVYYELSQLVEAIQALWEWRVMEDVRIYQQVTKQDAKAAQYEAMEALDHLRMVMDPVLKAGFLTKIQTPEDILDIDGEDPEDWSDELKDPIESQKESLAQIRRAYLPEMVLGYISALHCSAHLFTRDRLLDTMEMADVVAENEELTKAFQQAGKMRELVDMLAISSKTLLRMNALSGGRNGGKSRKKDARSRELWDVSV